MATKNTTGAPTLAERDKKAALGRAKRAASAAAGAVKTRDERMREAVVAGATRREVAEATGMALMTVQGIVEGVVRGGEREVTS